VAGPQRRHAGEGHGEPGPEAGARLDALRWTHP